MRRERLHPGRPVDAGPRGHVVCTLPPPEDHRPDVPRAARCAHDVDLHERPVDSHATVPRSQRPSPRSEPGLSRPGFRGDLEARIMSSEREILRHDGPTEEVPRCRLRPGAPSCAASRGGSRDRWRCARLGRSPSNARRTPRAISSSGYFFGRPMRTEASPSPRTEALRSRPPSNPAWLRKPPAGLPAPANGSSTHLVVVGRCRS
jgi:hypothetical protein